MTAIGRETGFGALGLWTSGETVMRFETLPNITRYVLPLKEIASLASGPN